jgi:mono/diheme cytochrome c family protein
MKSVLFAIFAVAIVFGIGYAAQSQPTDNVVVKVKMTPATSGQQTYVSYCAPCHGMNAKGNGPVAGSLKQQTTDLTVLSKNNGGKFPAEHIVDVLKFGMANPAHGTAEMPIWGPLFESTSDSRPDMTALRISNLSDYLKTVQVK